MQVRSVLPIVVVLLLATGSVLPVSALERESRWADGTERAALTIGQAGGNGTVNFTLPALARPLRAGFNVTGETASAGALLPVAGDAANITAGPGIQLDAAGGRIASMSLAPAMWNRTLNESDLADPNRTALENLTVAGGVRLSPGNATGRLVTAPFQTGARNLTVYLGVEADIPQNTSYSVELLNLTNGTLAANLSHGSAFLLNISGPLRLAVTLNTTNLSVSPAILSISIGTTFTDFLDNSTYLALGQNITLNGTLSLEAGNATGEAVSAGFDTGGNISGADISFNGTVPPGAAVNLSLRGSANGTVWGEWTPASAAPLERFVQWRAVLTANGTLVPPVLDSVTLTYRTYPVSASASFRLAGTNRTLVSARATAPEVVGASLLLSNDGAEWVAAPADGTAVTFPGDGTTLIASVTLAAGAVLPRLSGLTVNYTTASSPANPVVSLAGSAWNWSRAGRFAGTERVNFTAPLAALLVGGPWEGNRTFTLAASGTSPGALVLDSLLVEYTFRPSSVLFAPANGSRVVIPSKGEVDFSWNASDGDGEAVRSTLVVVAASGLRMEYPNLTVNAIRLPLLPGNYSWSVVPADGLSDGPCLNGTFSFSVKANAPPAVELLLPEENVTGNSTTLYWKGSDADGDALAYDLYFGAVRPPPPLASGLSATNFTVAGLTRQAYHWSVVPRDGLENGTAASGRFTVVGTPPRINLPVGKLSLPSAGVYFLNLSAAGEDSEEPASALNWTASVERGAGVVTIEMLPNRTLRIRAVEGATGEFALRLTARDGDGMGASVTVTGSVAARQYAADEGALYLWLLPLLLLAVGAAATGYYWWWRKRHAVAAPATEFVPVGAPEPAPAVPGDVAAQPAGPATQQAAAASPAPVPAAPPAAPAEAAPQPPAVIQPVKVRITCPVCRSGFVALKQAQPVRVQCPNCGKTGTLPGLAPAAPPAAPAAADKKYIVIRPEGEGIKPFSIEDIFLMYNDGRLIEHTTRRMVHSMDDDILTGMFVAVQGFVKESLAARDRSELGALEYGGSRIVFERSKYLFVAVVLSGSEPAGLREEMQDTLRRTESEFAPLLQQWDGNTGIFAGMKQHLVKLSGFKAAEAQKAVEKGKEDLVITRDVEFGHGYVLLKVEVRNDGVTVITDTSLKLVFNASALKMARVEPPFPIMGQDVVFGNLAARERKAVTVFLEPLAGGENQVDGVLTYKDYQGTLRHLDMKPKAVSVTPPPVYSAETLNTAVIRQILSDQRVEREARHYHLPQGFYPARAYELAKRVALGMDLRLSREFSDKEPLYRAEGWFCGKVRGSDQWVLLKASVVKVIPTLEFMVAAPASETVTSLIIEAKRSFETTLARERPDVPAVLQALDPALREKVAGLGLLIDAK